MVLSENGLLGKGLLSKFNKNIIAVDFYFVRSCRFAGWHASRRTGFDIKSGSMAWTLDLAPCKRTVAERATVVRANVV